MFFREGMVLFPRYHTSVKYGEFTIRRHIPNMEFYHTSIEGKWHFITNSKGFRNSINYNFKKPPNTLRIMSIGDSHTFGYEVSQEETFSSQIEKFLVNDSTSVQVINTGVSGFGTAEELVFLENEGIKYKPDYVILGFFRNDFDDNIRSNLFSLKHDSLTVTSKTYIPGVDIQDFIYQFNLIKWLSENSYLYSFTFNTVWDLFKNSSIAKVRINSKEYAINVNQTIDDYQMRLAIKLLERMHRICQKNSIKLIIIDVPSWEFDNTIISSIEDLQLKSEKPFCDYLIKFKDINAKLELNKILREKGHHHISDKTHKIIAELCASYIKSQINRKVR